MRLVLAFLLLISPVAAMAQISPAVTITPHRLRTMTPAELRATFFPPGAPEFVESWVEGPTRRIEMITVDLATRPRPTAYPGLCEVDIGSVSFHWQIGTQTEDLPLKHVQGRVHHRFLLIATLSEPGWGSDGAASCAAASALSRRPGPPPVLVLLDERQSKYSETNAEAAHFGYAALIVASGAANNVPVSAKRCDAGFTAIPLACNAPRDFVRTREPRHLRRLIVKRCDGRTTLCVDAMLARLDGCGMPWWAGACGEDQLLIETDIAALSDGRKLDASRIKSITIRAGSDPIID